MIRKNPSGDLPVIAESAYVDKTAIICGKVIIGENVFVGPYAVIRADEVDASGGMDPIVIGANSNIQDGVVIHSKSGAAVTIGEFTSIAHRSIVHGPCTVGDRVFIGAPQLGGRRPRLARRVLCALHDPHRAPHRPLAVPPRERQRLGIFRRRGTHQR
jgi:acyl-[acyl carrier protein]--UDP-N-acetylglucosamine O-acyltransferase